jgi:hydroxymethylpyrimidine/phosphomethylpyrimidine kinase
MVTRKASASSKTLPKTAAKSRRCKSPAGASAPSPSPSPSPVPSGGAYPRALTIAGSDSGGGAGIQADLKTFHACGAYGMTVITALTAQNTFGVQGILDIDPAFVEAQLDSVLGDIGCDAAKTGMLSTPGVIHVVARAVRRHEVSRLVVDPVMVAKGGRRLLQTEAVRSLVEELLPLALVATPNAEEASILAACPVETVEDMKTAARAIRSLGAKYVLVKGGHVGMDAPVVADVLLGPEGKFQVFESRRVDARHTHGTGCTLSAAIAAYLARGCEVREAVEEGRRFIAEAIGAAKPLGGGIGPVNHLCRHEAREHSRSKINQ